MKARNSLGRSISLLNDAEPAARQSSDIPPKGGLLRTMSTPLNISAPLVPVSTYRSDHHSQSPPELLRTESSGSSINRTPSPPTPCTVDEIYSHHTYPKRGAEMLEKVPQGYPSPLHQRSISRSYSDDSEWLPSPPASPRPLKTPSLMRAAKNRDSFNFAAPPVSPQREDTHWAEPLSDAPKPDKRRYTWSPPPEQRPRLSLPVRNRDSLESRAAAPTDPPTSPARRKEIVVQVSIDASLQDAAKPKQRQSEKRRYVCPVGMCVKTFSTSGHASRHAKTHEGRREHVCGECFKRFGRRDNMRQHMTTHAAVQNAGGSGSNSNSNSSSGNIRSSNSKRRKSYGPSCEVTSEGGLAPVPVPEPSGARQPSAMDLLAAAAAAAEFPAVGDLTLR